MNRKYMPIILMLVAGAVTCIITFVKDYSISAKVLSLILVLVLFYLLGSALKWTLDYFDKQNEKRNQEEGEVIQKETETVDNKQTRQ